MEAFSVGDRVRVKADVDSLHRGYSGTVEKFTPVALGYAVPYPYYVTFPGIDGRPDMICPFASEELEECNGDV